MVEGGEVMEGVSGFIGGVVVTAIVMLVIFMGMDGARHRETKEQAVAHGYAEWYPKEPGQRPNQWRWIEPDSDGECDE